MSSRSVTPTWLPPTLAMALWQQGRKEEAVACYAAAVRTEPAQFRATSLHAQVLPDWSKCERDTLAEVQAGWARNPPAWPKPALARRRLDPGGLMSNPFWRKRVGAPWTSHGNRRPG